MADEGLTNQLENIKVAVRLRPFTEKEKSKNSRRIVDIEQNTVVLYSPKYGDVNLKRFTFDYSYWSHDGFKRNTDGFNVPDSVHPNSEKYVGQEKVFDDLGQFLLINALQGYNSALLAYGQTGSGKSYTVSGYGQNEGILPRFARALFEELDKKAKVLTRSSKIVDENTSEQTSPDEGARKEDPDFGKENNETNNNRYEVFFSMIEIYNEVVRDLLPKDNADMVGQTARRGLKVREHPKRGFFVENLSSYACLDKDEIERRIEEGQLNKSIAATSMNETSSRGHTIYEFRIKQYKLKSPASPEETLTTSVVQLVDLAGSERMAVHVTGSIGGDSFIGSRSNSPHPNRLTAISSTRRSRNLIPTSASSTNSTPQQSSSTMRRNMQKGTPYSNHLQRFKESVSINQSLSALGNCIQVMSQYSQQAETNGQTKKQALKIPYRDSALTKLLNKCCLSGNSKVVIIATLSPADMNYDDTLSTLRFADRAKQIRTHAIINRMSRSEIVDTLQKENDRLKQMVDGRVTRSDDSSQTSNFDDTESAMENFMGSKIDKKSTNIDAVATPIRSRTTIRKARDSRQTSKKSDTIQPTRLASSSSNPSLVTKDHMKHLVSPASKKLAGDKTMRKSKSIGQGLSKQLVHDDSYTDESEDTELRRLANPEVYEEIDLNELGDIQEGLISPESDDSNTAIADEDLTNEEKIGMFNKLFSNSVYKQSSIRGADKSRVARPKRASRVRSGIKQVSVLSSSLKRANPYLSNLNQDEQLTGMISYIIKQGQNVIGKNSDCDIVLHGPELRGQHAKVYRLTENNVSDGKDKEGVNDRSVVFIEPISDTVDGTDRAEKNVALKVNGNSITERTQLNHCDRLLFGSNAYFVFIDNVSAYKTNDATIADPDLVTFDMARNEVLQKIMAEANNEAMIKEINDYTHRPGTGKHRIKSGDPRHKGADHSSPKVTSRLKRSLTIHDHGIIEGLKTEDSPLGEGTLLETGEEQDGIDSQEALYRDQLLNDTYEFALPVAEVNAVAREMGIKVTYALKILTGEEQLPDQSSSAYMDSITSDGASSSSTGDGGESDKTKVRSADQMSSSRDLVTQLNKLDYLDIAPALFVKIHLEEHNLDFYWSKEKFQARRYKILELFGSWDVGGKSGLVEYLIDQSRTQGDYLIDPFVDNPSSTFVLIGHAQITLESISNMTDFHQSYDLLDLNDEIVGSINIEAVPCHPEELSSSDDGSEPYRPFEPVDLASSSRPSLDELLENSSIRTRVLRDDSLASNDESSDELQFNHSHYICIDEVNQDVLDFLQRGFLTIQVLGLYKLSDTINKSPTMISTIINSINKYKFRMGQQHAYNYAGSAYYSDSAKSNQGPTSGAMNSNSGASSVVSASATVNLFDQQNDDDDASNSVNGFSQENIIDMILTKRKLDRAENQLHYLKRTVNIAEHCNKKHIPVKTVKKLLNSRGRELDNGSLEEMTADVSVKGRNTNGKNSNCSIQ